MANKDDALATEIEQLRNEITRISDEVRVRLHLGAMDLRDAFYAVQHELDHVKRDATQTTRRALVAARQKLHELSNALEGAGPSANKGA